MRKIELLSPAGDLERLKYAIDYGADAVYIGGKQLSLRSMASNFSLEDIKEGCDYAHERGKKVFVTCNIVMHESDTPILHDYLIALDEAGVDAVIASSPKIISAIKEYTHMEAHVSTQQSVSNSKGVNFFKRLGADRVVLARECTLEDIKKISKNTDIDLEVFIEGAMCASVSGRCMLSNIMTNRDANRGGCAQSCRWNYDLYKGEVKISPNEFDFAMSSKDLNAIEFIPELIKAGVASLKIEGRMKSLHYVATVVNAYRKAIDDYYQNGKLDDLSIYYDNLKKGENREVSHGFFKGDITPNEIIYNHNKGAASHDFLGIIVSYDKDKHIAAMEVRNLLTGNRDIEILTPNKAPFIIHINDIYDKDGNIIEVANHPEAIIYFKIDVPLKKHDLIR